MLVDHWISWTSDIHKFKCYIVVIQEIGNISLRSILTIKTPIKDFISICMYSRVIKPDIQSCINPFIKTNVKQFKNEKYL